MCHLDHREPYMKKWLFLVVSFFSFVSSSQATTSLLKKTEFGVALACGAAGLAAYGCHEMIDLKKPATASLASKMDMSLMFVRMVHHGLACINYWDDRETMQYVVPWLLFDAYAAYKMLTESKNVEPAVEAIDDPQKFLIVPALLSIGRGIALLVEWYAGVKLASGTNQDVSAAMLSFARASGVLMNDRVNDKYVAYEKGFATGVLGLTLWSVLRRKKTEPSQLAQKNNVPEVNLYEQPKQQEIQVLTEEQEELEDVEEEQEEAFEETEREASEKHKPQDNKVKKYITQEERDAIFAKIKADGRILLEQLKRR